MKKGEIIDMATRITISTAKNALSSMVSRGGARGIHSGQFNQIVKANKQIQADPTLREAAYKIGKHWKEGYGGEGTVSKQTFERFMQAFTGHGRKGFGGSGIKATLTRQGRTAAQNPKTTSNKILQEQIADQVPKGPSEQKVLLQKKKKMAIKALNIRKAVERREETEGRFVLHEEEKGEKSGGGKDITPSAQKTSSMPMTGTTLPRDQRSSPGLGEAEGVLPQTGGEKVTPQDENMGAGGGKSAQDKSLGREDNKKGAPSLEAEKLKKDKEKKEGGEPDTGGLFES